MATGHNLIPTSVLVNKATLEGKISMLNFYIGHDERVWSMCWHPESKTLASCSADKTIKIWNYEDNVFNCAVSL
jgi:WD40 repeat protein